MTLLTQINEAASALMLKERKIQQLVEFSGLELETINEAVTQFLRSAVNRIEKGEFKAAPNEKSEEFNAKKERLISALAAVSALTDINTALAYEPDEGNTAVGVEGDKNSVPLGSVLQNFYGRNGEEAHKAAQARLVQIGREVSPTLRQAAAKAVDDTASIREYVGKLQTAIEPVMNRLISMERQKATNQIEKTAHQSKQSDMARPMQGTVPQRN